MSIEKYWFYSKIGTWVNGAQEFWWWGNQKIPLFQYCGFLCDVVVLRPFSRVQCRRHIWFAQASFQKMLVVAQKLDENCAKILLRFEIIKGSNRTRYFQHLAIILNTKASKILYTLTPKLVRRPIVNIFNWNVDT